MISEPIYCPGFIGREAQLDALYSRYLATADAGSVMLVSGEAGMGKTRLLREFCERLARDGARFAFATCLEYARAPLAPIVDALRMLLSGRPGVLDAIPERVRALARLMPDLSDEDAGEELDRTRLFESVGAVLHHLSANDTHVLIIDDIHWADPATLQLLQYVSRYVLSAKLLLVLAFRDEDQRSNAHLSGAISYFEREPYTWRISLEPLGDTEMLALMHSALEGRAQVSPQTIESVRDAAEGNPLNAEELLKNAVEKRPSLREYPGLPRTLREAIVERLSHLGEDERAVLLTASVIGRRFDPGFLAQTLQRDPQEVVAALRKGVALQLLIEQSGDTVLYAFRHALTREAIYGELLAIEARPLHARIAAEIEAGVDASDRVPELAYHYWAAGDAPKSAQYNRLAGDRATAVYAYHDAARAYERALSASKKIGTPALDVEVQLAAALEGEGETAAALEHTIAAQNAYEAARDYDRAAECCYNTIGLYQKSGDDAGMQRATAHALELAARNPQSRTNFAAHLQLAWDRVSRRDGLVALETLNAARELRTPATTADTVRYHVIRGAAAAQQDDAAQVPEAFEEAIRIAQASGDAPRLAMAYQYFATYAAFAGLREHAIRAIDATWELTHGRRLGNDRAISALSEAAEAALFLGLLHKAQELVREALTYPTDAAAMRFDTLATAIEIALLLEDETAIELAGREAFLEAARIHANDRQWIKIAYVAADVLNASGLLEPAQAMLHRIVDASSESLWLAAVPEVCVRVAEFGAREDLEKARAYLNAGSSTGRLYRAYAALFEAYAQRGTHARAAAELFLDLGLPLQRARALELGGKSEDAYAIYRDIGDRRDERRLEGALRPVNRRGRAKDELTAREREIARLVAQGQSNAAIASALSISERTVEHHVTAIFAKLGLGSRAEVAAYVTKAILGTARP